MQQHQSICLAAVCRCYYFRPADQITLFTSNAAAKNCVHKNSLPCSDYKVHASCCFRHSQANLTNMYIPEQTHCCCATPCGCCMHSAYIRCSRVQRRQPVLCGGYDALLQEDMLSAISNQAPWPCLERLVLTSLGFVCMEGTLI